MSDDFPKFLVASDADRASWRAQPLSKEFIELLSWQRLQVEEAILQHVRAKKHDEANRLDGKLEALQELSALIFHRSPVAAVVEEDDFLDPATRPSTLMKGSHESSTRKE